MLMKTLLLVSATYCLFIIAECENVPIISEVHEKCRQEFRLDEEQIAKLNETRYLETEDEKIKCFVKCFFIGLTLMNESGEFNLEKVDVKNSKFKKHFDVCKEVNGTDVCDKAVNFQNCMWKKLDSEEEVTE